MAIVMTICTNQQNGNRILCTELNVQRFGNYDCSVEVTYILCRIDPTEDPHKNRKTAENKSFKICGSTTRVKVTIMVEENLSTGTFSWKRHCHQCREREKKVGL